MNNTSSLNQQFEPNRSGWIHWQQFWTGAEEQLNEPTNLDIFVTNTNETGHNETITATETLHSAMWKR
jgi:hypothetical protein